MTSQGRVAGSRNWTRWLVITMLAAIAVTLVTVRPMVKAATKEVTAEEHHLLLSSQEYHDEHMEFLPYLLEHRVEVQPFNLISLFLFACAIVHTFFTHRFTTIAHRLEEEHRARSSDSQVTGAHFDLDTQLQRDKSFSAEFFHFMGEVEAVFIIWVIPLVIAITYFFDWHTAVEYIQSRSYVEPLFVVVIMTLSATRPIVNFAERCLTSIAMLGGQRPAAWWLTILTVGPLLGSLITEPAAMTLCAMLLTKQFYRFKPSNLFKYATLGLLFTNISVGGTLTHFAAPPVLMVSDAWDWDTPYMAAHFGWKAVVGIIIANVLYFLRFSGEFPQIAKQRQAILAGEEAGQTKRSPVPTWITAVHLGMLVWVIFTNHYPALFIGGFLLFLAFYEATAAHQNLLRLRGPILVGCFLAGLVIHGGLQEWWISAVLQKVDKSVMMVSAIALTAFNDNAAITYLTTLVPNFTATMKYAVVAGAVAGGGLTVIANAPNPAGFSLLGKHFEDGISPLGLFLAAAIPTVVVSCCLAFL